MTFFDEIKRIKKLKDDGEKITLPSNHFFLEDGSVLAYPRGDGDTRQPYINDGMMLWAYACGYIRAQEGKFSIFPEVKEGEEPHVAFFANVDGELISLLGMPILNEKSVISRYTVLTDAAVYYFTETEGYTFAVRVFLTKEKEMRFSVGVISNNANTEKITVSSFFNPYLRNDNSSYVLWYRYFKEGRVKDDDTVTFYVTEGDKKDCNIAHWGIRQFCAEGCHVIYREQTTKKAQFNGGINCNLNNAYAARACKIEEPVHCTAFNDYAIAGDVTTLEFEKEARLEYRFAISNDKVTMSGALTDALFNEINHSIKSELYFDIDAVKDTAFTPETLTQFLRKVQYQVNICALGKDMGGGGNIGFRDVAQQVEQCAVWNAEDCRKKILVIMSHMFPDGRAPRTFSIPEEGQLSKMSIPNYIDMGIWMINAIDNYLRFTGDYSILDEICGYYEIVDEKGVVKKSDKEDSLLCHMIAIVDRLVRNIAPDSNCVRMLYADWNDAIDSLGNTKDKDKKFGTGVSVMATLQAYENLVMMNNIFRAVGGHEEDIKRYEDAMLTIKQGVFSNAIVEKDGERRVLHGWGDKREFLVGSFCDVDGKSRISSTSQSFFAMSSLYRKEYEKDILNSFRKLDSKYGFRTFDEPFSPDIMGIGRIGKLPAGTAENAGTYIHAALFGVLALYKIGCEREANEQLLKLLPISYEKVDKTPYVMQNAYCYNPDINVDGSALNDWFTGSAAVVMKTVITNVFGIQPGYDALKLSPAKCSFLKKATVRLPIRGNTVELTLENTGSFSLKLNGRCIEGNEIKYTELEKENKITVTF